MWSLKSHATKPEWIRIWVGTWHISVIVQPVGYQLYMNLKRWPYNRRLNDPKRQQSNMRLSSVSVMMAATNTNKNESNHKLPVWDRTLSSRDHGKYPLPMVWRYVQHCGLIKLAIHISCAFHDVTVFILKLMIVSTKEQPTRWIDSLCPLTGASLAFVLRRAV